MHFNNYFVEHIRGDMRWGGGGGGKSEKSVHRPSPLQGGHGLDPYKGSDPKMGFHAPGSMFCPHPCWHLSRPVSILL